MEGALSALGKLLGFSDSGKNFPAEKDTSWPTQADVDAARHGDYSYGDTSAGFLNPGSAKVKSAPISAIPDMANYGKLSGKPTEVTQDMADRFYRTWLASRRSAIAALGYEPRNMVVSPMSENRLTVAGLYDPSNDTSWFDPKTESSAVHESFHRSIEKLRSAGLLPPITDSAGRSIREEMLVRKLMMENFGDIEKGRGDAGDAQIAQASRINLPKGFIDALEKIAAAQIARQRPMGPR